MLLMNFSKNKSLIMEKFILSNDDRKYLGLTPIEDHWERMDIKEVTLFFDGDIIRKEIINERFEIKQFSYFEQDVYIETAENRTIVLPKTSKGKPKKLNYTATTTFNGIGVYFRYSEGYVRIANFTTQKTFFSQYIEGNDYKNIFDNWLINWKKECTEEDLKDLEIFKNETRKRQKYKEGDIFCFKIDRRHYGFGKILIDIVKRRKTKEFKQNKNNGLDNLMGTALIVKVYHKISDNKNVDIDELEKGLSLPAQAFMDNRIIYNEYEIIGNRSVNYSDLDDSIISFSKSINYNDPNTVYLQYGLIYKEMTIDEYRAKSGNSEIPSIYRNEGIGFFLYLDSLEKCIEDNSNNPYWEDVSNDLRNPENKAVKERIFSLFGLNAGLGYEENLKLANKK